jgi:arylsulfatase A
MIPPWVKTNHPLDLYRGAEAAERVTDQSTPTPRYTAEAVKFIRSAGDSPFFLYLAYAMPHLPVSAPADRKGRSRAGLYGGTIETLDWSAGEILGTIRDRGLDDRTMVVFASDNGPWNYLPSRMLQNGVEPWHTGSPGLLRRSKGTTYEGGQRVPGIVRWPGVIPAGQGQSGMASTLDLFPTLTRAAAASLRRDRPYDGMDLLPAMKSRTEPGRKEFFSFRGTALEAVRSGSWKYRLARNAPEDGRPADPGAAELFDLDLDPAEHYNVLDRHRDIAEKLSQRMREFAAEVGGTFSSRKAAAAPPRHPMPSSSTRSSGVPHTRQITDEQSPHTSGSPTGRLHFGQ